MCRCSDGGGAAEEGWGAADCAGSSAEGVPPLSRRPTHPGEPPPRPTQGPAAQHRGPCVRSRTDDLQIQSRLGHGSDRAVVQRLQSPHRTTQLLGFGMHLQLVDILQVSCRSRMKFRIGAGGDIAQLFSFGTCLQAVDTVCNSSCVSEMKVQAAKPHAVYASQSTTGPAELFDHSFLQILSVRARTAWGITRAAQSRQLLDLNAHFLTTTRLQNLVRSGQRALGPTAAGAALRVPRQRSGLAPVGSGRGGHRPCGSRQHQTWRCLPHPHPPSLPPPPPLTSHAPSVLRHALFPTRACMCPHPHLQGPSDFAVLSIKQCIAAIITLRGRAHVTSISHCIRSQSSIHGMYLQCC